MRQYPPHHRYVATLPWEIKNSDFLHYSVAIEENANKLHFIASNVTIHPQILIFSVFNIASFPNTDCE